MDNSIVLKIKKLLALSESSNENESKIAMLRVQELLAKHKLSLADVKNANIEEVKVVSHETDVVYRKSKWKGVLASIISENFSCHVFSRLNKSYRVCFLGREEDVTVCNLVFEYAIDCIDSKVKMYQSKYRKKGLSVKGLENTYALGFVNGLEESFRKQKENNKEWGLVLTKPKEVTEAYNNITFSKKKRSSAIYTNNDKEVYDEAKKDGLQFSISDKIAREDNSETLMLNQN